MSPARRYCRCGTPLARDNTARLCSTCQAARRRDRAPDVPPEFWQTDVMAAALASGDLGRVLRAYRCHPFHGQRLPQALLAGWLHTSQAAVCRMENGRRRVTIDEIAVVARALGMPVALPWIQYPVKREKTWIPSAVGAFLARASGPHWASAPRPHPQQPATSTPSWLRIG